MKQLPLRVKTAVVRSQFRSVYSFSIMKHLTTDRLVKSLSVINQLLQRELHCGSESYILVYPWVSSEILRKQDSGKMKYVILVWLLRTSCEHHWVVVTIRSIQRHSITRAEPPAAAQEPTERGSDQPLRHSPHLAPVVASTQTIISMHSMKIWHGDWMVAMTIMYCMCIWILSI